MSRVISGAYSGQQIVLDQWGTPVLYPTPLHGLRLGKENVDRLMRVQLELQAPVLSRVVHRGIMLQIRFRDGRWSLLGVTPQVYRAILEANDIEEPDIIPEKDAVLAMWEDRAGIRPQQNDAEDDRKVAAFRILKVICGLLGSILAILDLWKAGLLKGWPAVILVELLILACLVLERRVFSVWAGAGTGIVVIHGARLGLHRGMPKVVFLLLATVGILAGIRTGTLPNTRTELRRKRIR